MEARFSYNFYLEGAYLPATTKEAAQFRKNNPHSDVPARFLAKQRCPIYLYIYLNGHLKKVKLTFDIVPSHWDFRSQRVKGINPANVMYNLELEQLSSKAYGLYKEALDSDRFSDANEILGFIKHKLFITEAKVPDVVLLDAIETRFLKYKQEEESIKELTVRKYKSFFKLIREFEKQSGTKAKASSFGNDFINELCNYFLKEKGHNNATISKYQQCAVTVAAWIKKEGLIKHLGTSKLRDFNYDTSKLIALDQEEVNAIIDLDLTNYPNLDMWRNRFIMACFTGQRFSDIQALDLKDIQTQGDYTFWKLYQIKGTKTEMVQVPLHPICLQIIEKYRNGRSEGPLFKNISNQKFNDYIKVICQKAGIEKKVVLTEFKGKEKFQETKPKYQCVSSHTARATFVTLSLKNQVHTEVIMKITGHVDRKTMKKYEKFSPADIAESFLSRFK